MTETVKKFRRTKLACYFTGFSMSAASNISAILFISFYELYGITFTQLGFLVLVNFCTQLLIDLVFTFFSERFNLTKTIKAIPLVVLIGMLVYAVLPSVFPDFIYPVLVAGTLIFSLGAGLGEVLTSPVIAAIPSENPEGEMSKLHSAYAWGTVVVVIISTLILKIISNTNWMYLVVFWSLLPLISLLLFAGAEIPELNLDADNGNTDHRKNRVGILLFTVCIFFGGAAECTMMQWISGFAEKALGLEKIYGDIFGMALFAFALGSGRTLYSKLGKGIHNVLLYGMLLSGTCYVVAAVSNSSIVGLVACILTGFFTSMLWPGTIIYTNSAIGSCGVGVYALLAAGGDLGASLSPQLVGIIADKVSASQTANELSVTYGISVEQIGLKAGMICAAFFPIIGFTVLIAIKKYLKKIKGAGA